MSSWKNISKTIFRPASIFSPIRVKAPVVKTNILMKFSPYNFPCESDEVRLRKERLRFPTSLIFGTFLQKVGIK